MNGETIFTTHLVDGDRVGAETQQELRCENVAPLCCQVQRCVAPLRTQATRQSDRL
jgi:hypothetical protein